MAWRFSCTLDTDRLERVLNELAAETPCLTLRFRYDDHSGLIKTYDAEALPPVSRHRASSQNQALDALALQQATPFDLHRTAPARFMLFSLPTGETLFALIVHQIVAEQLSWEALLTAISQRYQGEAAAVTLGATRDSDLTLTGNAFTLPLGEAISEPLKLVPLAAAATPATTASISASSGPDRSTLAALILGEFREALAAPAMRAEDDFFDLGGHSLIATRVIGRLLSLHQVEVHINDLFSYPSAQALAAHARQMAAPLSGDERYAVAEGDLAPLSLAQQSLWKIYAAMGCSDIFNLPFVLRFIDEVDEQVFQQALHDVLVRHAGLRTLFIADGGEVRQQVVPADGLAQYRWFWPTESGNKESGALLKQEAGYLFDLAQELPLRVRFVREDASGQQLLSLLFHHIVLDEWSVNLLMDDLQQAYQARAADRLPTWKEQPAPFPEFAIGQHNAGLNQQHLDYWLDQLRGVEPGKPIFQTQAAQPGGPADVAGGNVEFLFDQTVADGLYSLTKQHSASLFNVVYAGIATALHLLGAPQDMVIGTSASGRNDARFFDTIGYFTTVVAHRLRFDRAPTLATLIRQVKATINDSMPHTDIPIDRVEEALLGADAREDAHIFEVFIQIHSKIKLNGVLKLDDGRQIAFRQVNGEKSESILGLQFEIMEEWEAGIKSIRIMLTYRDHYSPEQIALITDTTQAVLAEFTRHPCSDLSLDTLRNTLGL
nr:condensation domain-containing protein [Erwinia sp. JH02]